MDNLDLSKILGNKQVSLEEVLAAREKRVLNRQSLLTRYNLPLICFTLNIPGPIKTFPLAQKAFDEGKALILRQLERHQCKIVYDWDNLDKTGYEFYGVMDNDPYDLKKLMVAIEDSCPLGRLFDIDVLKPNGEKIMRQEIDCYARTCLICQEAAPVCGRSRKHSLEELLRKIVEIISDYFNHQFANACAACACRALLYEVCITPKPGLVDRANNGSHKDMDIYTFIDSASALTPYFRDFVLAGIQFYKDEPQQLFQRIRYLGMQAEEAMFLATHHVNTHKGLIFSLGIICTALGYLFANDQNTNINNILDLCGKMTRELINNDFQGVTLEKAKTSGEKFFAKYRITGIRGEAASGFSSLKEYGLPFLKVLIEKGYSLNDAGVLTLLNLIANVKDTNIIARSNLKTQEEVQSDLKRELDTHNGKYLNMNFVSHLDKKFIEMNISPGGCADLLAMSFMLYFLEESLLNNSLVSQGINNYE